MSVQKKLRLLVALILLLPLAALGAAYLLAPGLYEEDLATPVAHRESDWTGSQTCQSCHPDQYASWRRTFHSTMTQAATPEAVQGRFDGEIVTYYGVSARPVREGDEFFIEYLDPRSGRVTKKLKIAKTVGSRRYQQYVVEGPPGEPGDNLYRIPLLWHIGEQRWIHLNGAFLHADEAQHYDSHTAIWNQNCIFCHNTGPNPGILNYDDMMQRASRGEPVNSATDGKYSSSVAEMGISCESCHAPAEEHADRNRNPLRRYLLHAQGGDDPTIVHPAKLDQKRSVQVCGQCHGQRLPKPQGAIEQWMKGGPVFRAGEDLTDSITPVSIHTPGPPNNPDMFSLRFWPDGTPRLSAYEYQGIVSSPCYLQDESFTCNTCHSMHDGDIRGQIKPEMRTKAACESCHQKIVENVAEHTHHKPEGSGSDCYECHMPKMMYGVLDIHRTHRIHNPDPAHDAENARPNACTNCHLDKSLIWAAEKSAEWWGGKEQVLSETEGKGLLQGDGGDLELREKYRIPTYRADGAPVELADSVAALYAGDPVQRAVAARLAGRKDSPLSIDERAFLWPVLLYSMENNYPTIRYFSRSSLISINAEKPIPGMDELLESFDYIAALPQRQRWMDQLWTLWREHNKDGLPIPDAATFLLSPDYALLEDQVTKLVELQIAKEIHIGE